MSILQEYSSNITFVSHVHVGDQVITAASSDDNYIHIFVDVSSKGCFKIPTKLFCIALLFLKNGFKYDQLMTMEKLAQNLDVLHSLFFVGGYFVGAFQKKFVLFESQLLKDIQLLFLRKEILSYAAKTTSLEGIDHKSLTLVECVSPLLTSDGIQIDRDLFVSLFGLDAFHRKSRIILFIFDDGEIRFASLDNFLLEFLYCVEAAIRAISYDAEKNVLKVVTAHGKIFNFSSDVDTFVVSQTGDNANDGVSNVCKNKHPACSPRIRAVGNCLLLNKFSSVNERPEKRLDGLRADIRDLQLKLSSLKGLTTQKHAAYKDSRKLTEISSKTSKWVETSYTQTHLKISLLGSVPFDSFFAVCWGVRETRTISTRRNLLEIPVHLLLHTDQISCGVRKRSEVVNLGPVSCDLLCFASEQEQPLAEIDFKYNFKLFFRESFTTRNGNICSFLLGINQSSSSKCISIAGYYLRTQLHLRNDLFVFEMQSTSDIVLRQLHRRLLAKILKNLKENSVPLPSTNELVYG